MENHIVNYNPDENTLLISSLSISPLKIEYIGDIEFQVNGEFNLLTVDKPINIDSVNSKIYLNSLMCKSLRDVNSNINLKEEKITLDCSQETKIIPLLLDRITELENRIISLEKTTRGINGHFIKYK